MAEELQHLIEKLQSEAVSQADAQAAEIVAKAKQEAAALVADAEKQAEQKLAQAELDAKQYAERSTRTLEQVSRDVLISVGQGIERLLDQLVSEATSEAMSVDVLQEMLVRMVDNYSSGTDAQRRLEVLVAPEDQEKITSLFASRLKDKLAGGAEVKTAQGVGKGFRVSFEGDHAHHDFSQQAISESLARFLRPHLADIVMNVAGSTAAGNASTSSAA